MLTGDGQASADAVAQEVGIDEVRARLLPQDKLIGADRYPREARCGYVRR